MIPGKYSILNPTYAIIDLLYADIYVYSIAHLLKKGKTYMIMMARWLYFYFNKTGFKFYSFFQCYLDSSPVVNLNYNSLLVKATLLELTKS